MIECTKCKGELNYTVFDHRADSNISLDCWDCLSELNYQDNVAEDLSRLLRKASPEKLAQILSTYVVKKMYDEKKGDLSRLENIIKSKQLADALAICQAYAD